mmetsp:Transcript_46182/g.76954  ORF Transcript_46182/g.76954 Transcript_46182/m.76954 type:complete len:312 (+) Transcript_46182:315-1250(+)
MSPLSAFVHIVRMIRNGLEFTLQRVFRPHFHIEAVESVERGLPEISERLVFESRSESIGMRENQGVPEREGNVADGQEIIREGSEANPTRRLSNSHLQQEGLALRSRNNVYMVQNASYGDLCERETTFAESEQRLATESSVGVQVRKEYSGVRCSNIYHSDSSTSSNPTTKKCLVCCTKEREVRMTCGHSVACVSCTSGLTQPDGRILCPVCRSLVHLSASPAQKLHPDVLNHAGVFNNNAWNFLGPGSRIQGNFTDAKSIKFSSLLEASEHWAANHDISSGELLENFDQISIRFGNIQAEDLNRTYVSQD